MSRYATEAARGILTLSATVEDERIGGPGAPTLTYHCSSNFTISTSDTSVGTDAVSAVAVGSDSDESISLTAPSTADTYYYALCVA